jgi:hypothetical protein
MQRDVSTTRPRRGRLRNPPRRAHPSPVSPAARTVPACELLIAFRAAERRPDGSSMGLIVQCDRCGQSYASVFIEQARAPRCRCGAELELTGRAPQFIEREALLREERRVDELTRAADLVSFLIVATDCPRIDVDIQRANLKRRVAKLFPDKMDLYEMVYESRFRRLWEQFRNAER